MRPRALVMGVLNVTPDSFSDGGRFLDPAAAVAHGRAMIAAGADVIDVGGESTRPGATAVDEDAELARVIPVVEQLSTDARVSIDTRHASVASAAIEAGATLINDISASLWPVAAETGAGWVAMHMQGEPGTMQDDPHYDDVVAEVAAFLAERGAMARADGVDEVWIDPGIGFGKRDHHNLALLRHLPDLCTLGYPMVIGTSRKGMLGRLTGGAPVDDRLEASLATATWAFAKGAAMVRAHDVAPTVQAATLVGGER